MRSVLIITPSFLPEIGGVETRFNDICNELDKRGYIVTVLTYQPLITSAKGLPIEKKGNITIYRTPWIGFDLFHKLKPYPILQALYLCPALLLRSLIFMIKKRTAINVIHTAGFSSALIGRVLKGVFKKRWIVSTHAIYDLKPGFTSRMIRWILSGADVILTLSEPSRQELIRIGISSDKLINQITWVNQDLFKPLDKETCKRMVPHKNNFIVLFVGRLFEIKGIRDLVSIARDTPSIDYLFIGDGPLAAFLKKEEGIAKNIYFLSRVENEELPLYYNAADAVVMPSQYKEGLGRVVVEALYCGTPVIASNLGGLAYLLDSSVSIMIEPDRENIKSAITDLYEHPKKLSRLRDNCREFALRKFGLQNFEVIANAYNLN
ncbi:MAG: glycosyltransferase family 4 protein [Candidatus Omnitrophota bacterium]